MGDPVADVVIKGDEYGQTCQLHNQTGKTNIYALGPLFKEYCQS